jgi:hypothetical protein
MMYAPSFRDNSSKSTLDYTITNQQCAIFIHIKNGFSNVLLEVFIYETLLMYKGLRNEAGYSQLH